MLTTNSINLPGKFSQKRVFIYLTKGIVLFFISSIFFANCSVTKDYSPDKKFAKSALQKDYSLLRNILEKKHPSLYWYTPKDSMDYFFTKGYNSFEDSMTELQFAWKVIAPLTNKIHCGHTSFTMSKDWNEFIRDKKIPSFPLHVKIWDDTLVITANLNEHDSVLKKGMLITAINGLSNHSLLQKMYGYLSQDGYSQKVNDIRLSMNFPYFHRNIFGIYKNYSVEYIDSNGVGKKTFIPYYDPGADTLSKTLLPQAKKTKITHAQKLKWIRSLKIDSAESVATLRLNSFSKGHLPAFFYRTFKILRRKKIKNIVVDIRNNGGGDINNYISLTRYLTNKSFKVADTAAAIAKNFRPYSRYIKADLFDKPALFFLSKKREDGKYHFGFWERRIIDPKKRNHFNGNVYVITNGLTFSASALFCNALKGQPNVKLVGEETGGGWYGNSGILIPDIILPQTKLRVRLPFFRLVQYNHVAQKGTGVLPDVEVKPTLKDVRENVDSKMEVVKEMILKNK